MRETKFKTFRVGEDDLKYICEQMPATVALRAQVEAVDIIGQPALVAIASVVGNGLDTSADAVVDALTGAITRKLTPDRAERLAFLMLKGVRCEGIGDLTDRDTFDEHFRGRLMHMYAVVFWSIGVNYADFFDAARSNNTIASGLETAKEALTFLMQTMRSGVSALSKEDSTSKT